MRVRRDFSRKKDKNLEGSDYREGLAAVLSIPSSGRTPPIWGVTKDKLGSPLARPVVDGIVSDKLTFSSWRMENWLQIIRKAIKARDAREAARKARDESRNGKKKQERQGPAFW